MNNLSKKHLGARLDGIASTTGSPLSQLSTSSLGSFVTEPAYCGGHKGAKGNEAGFRRYREQHLHVAHLHGGEDERGDPQPSNHALTVNAAECLSHGRTTASLAVGVEKPASSSSLVYGRDRNESADSAMTEAALLSHSPGSAVLRTAVVDKTPPIKTAIASASSDDPPSASFASPAGVRRPSNRNHHATHFSTGVVVSGNHGRLRRGHHPSTGTWAWSCHMCTASISDPDTYSCVACENATRKKESSANGAHEGVDSCCVDGIGGSRSDATSRASSRSDGKFEDCERQIVMRTKRGGPDERSHDSDNADRTPRLCLGPQRDWGEGLDCDDFITCRESLSSEEEGCLSDTISDEQYVDNKKETAAHRELRRKGGVATAAAADGASGSLSLLPGYSLPTEEDGYDSDSDCTDKRQEDPPVAPPRQRRPKEGVATTASRELPSSQDRLRHWLAVSADADVDEPLTVWTCSRCTLINDISSRFCDACRKRAPRSIGHCRRKVLEAITTEGLSSPASPPQLSPTTIAKNIVASTALAEDGNGGAIISGSDGVTPGYIATAQVSDLPSEVGDNGDRWTCSRCTLLNDISSRFCDACKKRAPPSIGYCKRKVLKAKTTEGSSSPTSPPPQASPSAIAKTVVASTTLDEDGEGGAVVSESNGVTQVGLRSGDVSTSVSLEGSETNGVTTPNLAWQGKDQGGDRLKLRACPRCEAANYTASDSCNSCGFRPKVRRKNDDSDCGSKELMEISESPSSSMGMDRLSDDIVLVVMEYVPELGSLLRLGFTHRRAAALLERHDETLFGPLCRRSYGQSQVDNDNRYYHIDQEQRQQCKWKDRCARNGVLPQVFLCGPDIRGSEEAGGCGRRGRCGGTSSYRLADLGILSPAQEREALMYDNDHLQESGTDNTTSNDDEQDSNAGYFGMETVPFNMYPCNNKTCHCLRRSARKHQSLPSGGEWSIIWGDFPGFRLVPRTEMMALRAEDNEKGPKTALSESESLGIHHAGDLEAYHVNSVTIGTFASTRTFDVVGRSTKKANNVNTHHQLALGTEHPQVMATVIYGQYIFLGFADGTVMSITSSVGSPSSVSEAPAADRDPLSVKSEETLNSCICNNIVIHSAVHAHSEEVSSLSLIYPESFDGDFRGDYSSVAGESFDHPVLVSGTFHGQVFVWPRATIDGTLDHASDNRWPIVAMGERDQQEDSSLPNLFSIAGFTIFRNDGLECPQSALNSNGENPGEHGISKSVKSNFWNGESEPAGEISAVRVDYGKRSAGFWMFTGDNKGTIHVWEKRLRTPNKSMSQRIRLLDADMTGKGSHRSRRKASWLEAYWNNDVDEFGEEESDQIVNGCRHICTLSATYAVSKKRGKSKRLSDWEQIPALVTQIKTVHLQGNMYLLSTTKTGTLTIWECCLCCMRERYSREPVKDDAPLPTGCLMFRKNPTSTKAGPNSLSGFGRNSAACRLFHLKKRVFVNPDGGAIEGMTVVGNIVITSGVNKDISAWDIVTGQHKGDLTMDTDMSELVSQSVSGTNHSEGALVNVDSEVQDRHGFRYDADNVLNTAVVYVEVKRNAIVALMRHGVVFEWRLRDLWMKHYVGDWRQQQRQGGSMTRPSQQGKRSAHAASRKNVDRIQGETVTLMRPHDGATIVGVPVSDAYCHICRYRRPSGFAFECRKRSHVYCKRHLLERLGMRLGDATMQCENSGSGSQRASKVLDCPACSLTCLCAKCQRELKP